MVEALKASSGCMWAICSGERPRSRPSRIASSFARADSSVSSMPALEELSRASDACCARRAL